VLDLDGRRRIEAAFLKEPDDDHPLGVAARTPVLSDSSGWVTSRDAVVAGLPTGTTSHDLRHHFASVLLAAGESVVAVAERLGHENASLILSTYGHLMPDSEERTRRAIDEAGCAISVPSEKSAS
jgi:integrase